jgi:hypothetical protein
VAFDGYTIQEPWVIVLAFAHKSRFLPTRQMAKV